MARKKYHCKKLCQQANQPAPRTLLLALGLACLLPAAARAEEGGGSGSPLLKRWTFGVGASAHFDAEDYGIQGKAVYGLLDRIQLSPNVTYFFDESWLSLDLDGHLSLLSLGKSHVFALAGAELATDFDWSEAGLNLGGGLDFGQGRKLGGYAELKYVISDTEGVVLSAGILF